VKKFLAMSIEPLSPCENQCPLLRLECLEVSRHHYHSAELWKPLWPKTVPEEDDPDPKKISDTLLIMCEYSSLCPYTGHRLTVCRYSHTPHGFQFFKFEARCTHTLYFYFSITREFTSLTSLGSIWCCQTEEGPA